MPDISTGTGTQGDDAPTVREGSTPTRDAPERPGPALSIRQSSRWLPWAKRAAAVLVIPIILGVAPRVYSNQLFLTNLIIYMTLAQGVNLIYGYTGYLPFGYVGFFGAGAYGAEMSVQFLHAPGIPAVLLGGVAAVVLGILLAPLLRLSGAYFALASLAASQALYYIVSSQSLTSVTNGPFGVNLAAIFNQRLAYDTGLVLLGVALALVVWVQQSHFGLSLRAIKSDPVSAAMAGVDVVRIRTIAWLIAAALAGLGGAVFAWTTSVFYPDTVFSLNISLFAIVFALFGGVGTLLGPIAGAFLLYALYQYIGLTEPQYFQLSFGVLIVLLVLFLPGGISSLARHWRSIRRLRFRGNARAA